MTPAAKSASVTSRTSAAVGYAASTLPTMPSGVTTPMPRCTPLSDPWSRKTSFEPAEAPVAITRAASVREGVRDLERAQRLGPVRHGQFRFQEQVFHFQAVQVRPDAAVLLLRGFQQDVLVEHAEHPAAHAFDHARQRRHRRHRPDPDHAHVLVVLHLHGEQHQLRQNHQHQDGDVPVAIDQRVHEAASGRRWCGGRYFQSIEILRSNLKSLSILPVPSTTDAERIVGDRNRQPGFLADALVQILQQRAAAGEHDAAVADVRGELGRRALERHANGVHDGRNAFRRAPRGFRCRPR